MIFDEILIILCHLALLYKHLMGGGNPRPKNCSQTFSKLIVEISSHPHIPQHPLQAKNLIMGMKRRKDANGDAVGTDLILKLFKKKIYIIYNLNSD